VLNSSLFPDSVNTTYTENGLSRYLDNYTVFGTSILNVSVANSTNNSNFVTGILWDASDANDGSFNGTQDIVFISKINQQQQGAHGIYDFEVRAPSRLELYTGPDLDRVVMYMELI